MARLIVLNKDEDTLSIIDTDSTKTIKTLPTSHNPHEVVISPDNKTSYITCSLGNAVDVLDNETLEITSTIHDEDFNFPHGLGIIDDKLYIASTYNSMIFVIDRKTHQVVKRFNTNQHLSHMIEFSKDKSRIYVPNIGSNNVTIIDTSTDEIVDHFPVGKGPEGLGVHEDGYIYVANQTDNSLYVIDETTLETKYKRRLGETPVRLVFSPDWRYALIPNRESKDLSVIKTNQTVNGKTRPWEIKRIPIGNWPGGVVFNNKGTHAYVANNKTNDISVIDMVSLKETHRIDAGIHPDGIAILENE